MDLKLKGRRALVTGASKGIGLACAESLAREGCHLVLVARGEDALAAAAGRLSAFGTEVAHRALDLSDSANVDRLAEEWAGVDILVNNAGAIPGGRIDEVEEARWRAAWDLKVFGYVNMTRRFYAAMKAQGRGVIVNVIGAAGERVDSAYITGSSGNAALMAFTRALGSTSAADGLRVVGINPGPVATERHETLMRTRAVQQFSDAERWRELTATLPFGRAARPEEIGAMAAFLASDLSAYTTGTIVTIDGGTSHRRGG